MTHIRRVTRVLTGGDPTLRRFYILTAGLVLGETITGLYLFAVRP